MPIDMKIGPSTWARTKQPHVKVSASSWAPLKRALVKTTAGWKEVWPSEMVYTHTGVGYNLNIHNSFGQPKSSGKYVFINNGYIGSSTTDQWALVTGAFPAGSTVVIINNGLIIGRGGHGASFASSGPGSAISQAGPGGPGLNLQTPVTIQNNGVIAGAGGGGGASGDFAGKSRYNFRGGGGAGIEPGVGGVYTWGNAAPSAATYELGGIAKSGSDGHGGNAGVNGRTATQIVNNDYSMMTIGAPAGIAIGSTGFIQAGSTGMDTSRVKGRQVGGTNRTRIRVASIGGRGQYGDTLTVNLAYDGPAGTISGSWISGGAMISVGRSGNTFTFTSTGSNSGYSRNTWRSGTMRFTLTTAEGSDFEDVYIRVGDVYVYEDTSGGGCCFTGDSLVTMYNGDLKRIDEVVPGDLVKTPFGYSEVDWIRLPVLANRSLLAMDDGKCKTSGEHCLWAKDPVTSEQWWATRDIGRWGFEALHNLGPGLNGKLPIDLGLLVDQKATYATEDGWKETSWTEVDAPEDTQLYHLYLKDHASYFVDGYLVIGELPRQETLIDWTQFTWDGSNEQTPVYSVYDYELPAVDTSPFKRISDK